MKAPLFIFLGALVLAAGSGLAMINKACKSSHHGWCTPVSDVRHHVKTKTKLTNVRDLGQSLPCALS
jgi:hypothetical protein